MTDRKQDLQAETPRRLRVLDLLDGMREVILVHGNAEYRLRLTSNDKVILTK